MTDEFFSKIKSNKIKTPTQRGFCIKKWHQCWKNINNRNSKRDKKIYESGVIIHGLLSEIRSELSLLYKNKTPDLTNEELLMAYVSISNRERNIISSTGQKYSNKNIHSITVSNRVGDDITFQEISDGAVDAVEKAIFFCQDRINKGDLLECGNTPMRDLEFIGLEVDLSQIYGIYESYWRDLLWGEFQLIPHDVINKEYVIKQPKSYLEVGAKVSQIRKSRLGGQAALISTSKEIQVFFDNDKFITLKKTNRRKHLKCREVSNSSEIIKTLNSDWKVKQCLLVDQFDKDILDNSFGNGFNINEALEVFRCLMLLSISYVKNYPDDDGFFNIKKLYQFCPRINKRELSIELAKATNFSFSKVEIILKFIEFTATSNKDLWCHPLISISDKEYTLLTSSSLTPVMNRVVEHWFVTLNITLQDKGIVYEKTVINGFNSALKSNEYINNYNEAVSKRIKVNGAEEEIDFLARVGNVILIGEAKSIVTTDSAISQYRTIEVLRHASAQVKRKTKFVKGNLKSIFANLPWDYDDEIDYVYNQFIINSGRMYVGFNIDGISVCDENILIKYFSANIIPLLSYWDEVTKKEKHIAWVKLYSNINELENNLCKYLKNPPQIFESENSFEYKKMKVPFFTQESYKIEVERFIPKDLSAKDVLSLPRKFPVETIKNIDKELEKLDFII